MTAPGQMVQLGEVLSRSVETVALLPDVEYRELTVKLWGKGVILRGFVKGAEVATTHRFVARAGNFVLSRIDARNGAFGLVPRELNGAIVTNDFPVFVVDEAMLLPGFLGWMSRTEAFVEMCEQASEGTTNRVRLQEDKFLAMRVFLPPLAEQRRVAGQIEQIASQLDQARLLRHQAVEEVQALSRSVLAQGSRGHLTPMRELVQLRQPDVTVRPDETYRFAGVYSFGRGVFQGRTRLGLEFAYSRLTTLRMGDFVYPKLMAWEGAFGVVPPECDGCVVSTEFPVFEVIADRVLPEVLDIYFRSPAVWPEISGVSTGTNVRRRRLNPEDFLNFRIPLPLRAIQEQLRSVQREVETLNRLQTETDGELSALLSSFLDRDLGSKLLMADQLLPVE